MSRLIGLLIAAAGAAFGKYAILDVLQQAQTHAPDVHYSVKSFVLAPLAIVGGLALFLGGKSVVPIFLGAPQGLAQKSLAAVIMAVAFSVTGVGFWLFKAQLSALGYGP